MKTGTYVGPNPKLKGQRALLRDAEDPSEVLAQFDNLELGEMYTHSWVKLPRTDILVFDEYP